VNVGSLYDKNGNKVDNLLSYKVAGTDVPVPEIKNVQDELTQKVDQAILDMKTQVEAFTMNGGLPVNDVRSAVVADGETIHAGDVVDVVDGKASTTVAAEFSNPNTYSTTQYSPLRVRTTTIDGCDYYCLAEDTYSSGSSGYATFLWRSPADPLLQYMTRVNGSNGCNMISAYVLKSSSTQNIYIYYSSNFARTSFSLGFFTAGNASNFGSVSIGTKYGNIVGNGDVDVAAHSTNPGIIAVAYTDSTFRIGYVYGTGCTLKLNLGAQQNRAKLYRIDSSDNYIVAWTTQESPTIINLTVVAADGSTIVQSCATTELQIPTGTEITMLNIVSYDSNTKTGICSCVSSGDTYIINFSVNDDAISMTNYVQVKLPDTATGDYTNVACCDGQYAITFVISNKLYAAAVDPVTGNIGTYVACSNDDVTPVSSGNMLVKNGKIQITSTAITATTKTDIKVFDSILKYNKIGTSVEYVSSDAIALESGTSGDEISVGYGGYCRMNNAKTGYTVESNGVRAVSPIDGWLDITAKYNNKPENHVVGTYVGTGSAMDIELGFEPSAVLIYCNNVGFDNGGVIYGGMIINGTKTYGGSYITDTGFHLINGGNAGSVVNSNVSYSYIAWR